MHQSFNVLVPNVLLRVSASSKCHHQGVRYEHAKTVPNVVKSREGWELYTVTDGVMVGSSTPNLVQPTDITGTQHAQVQFVQHLLRMSK
jgi:hypothetical protein